MSYLQKLRLKCKKDSNVIEVWDRDVLIKTCSELDSENLLSLLVKELNINKSNVLPFERKNIH